MDTTMEESRQVQKSIPSINDKSGSLGPLDLVNESDPSLRDLPSSLEVNYSRKSKSSLKSFKLFFNSLFHCSSHNPRMTSPCQSPLQKSPEQQQIFQRSIQPEYDSDHDMDRRIQDLEQRLKELQEVKERAVHLEELCQKLGFENLNLKEELKAIKKAGDEIDSGMESSFSCSTSQGQMNENLPSGAFKSACRSKSMDQNENEMDSLKTINFQPPLSSTFLPNPGDQENLTCQVSTGMLSTRTDDEVSGSIQHQNQKGRNLDKGIQDKIEWRVLTSPKNGGGDSISFVLVKVETEWTKKRGGKGQQQRQPHHYVARVKGQSDGGDCDGKKLFLVDFFKKASLEGYRFLLNEKEMNLIIVAEEIAIYLPPPQIQRRGYLRFDFDFSHYFMHC